ncbi:hypothetical protein NEOLEDRAFT_1102546 [Neolentinus lepideus HHB14362 ss-1]|uniref:RRM domain-containing protein n=1 Tax=Neolentinus lepideus HHB14362 ss-1 TaxID=1314782 RepID=A0A165N6P7_9AGAM|nr:hypothetical protein NEOLEDRAFT_1102546 [Neolentinus lepideus HHB14362 ss-1]
MSLTVKLTWIVLALGSWADEMDSLPTAPSARQDDDRSRANDRGFGRRDDYASSRSDRPPREDLPLPTQPPYTAFIGNLAFDLTETELGDFFGGSKVKSAKIIKDREEKPKGFGYVEFADLDTLKEALDKTGSSFAGRTIRVSVAEPPKERGGFGSSEDDSKFANPWRREGPLPDIPGSRDSSRRRFDGPPSDRERPTSQYDTVSDWRSNRPTRMPVPESETPSFRKRSSGFFAGDVHVPPPESDEPWAIGSKFKPSVDEASASKFGSVRGRSEFERAREPPPSTTADEGDWRSAARPRPVARNSSSPTGSTPPTPQMGRRKLELLPRSTSGSASPSPLASPKMASSTVGGASSRSNPFGAAKPVDVTAREQEVTQKIEREREAARERVSHPMSRTSSRTGTDRNPSILTRSPPPSSAPLTPSSPRASPAQSATVRPAVSFASAAGGRKELTSAEENEQKEEEASEDRVGEITSQVAEVAI